MKRRFTTLVVVEQNNTNDEIPDLDDVALHDQIIESLESEEHNTEVVAVTTITEKWDPENDRWEVVE